MSALESGWEKLNDVEAIEQQIPAAEMERMMKLQEVILKAMAGKLKWWEAAEIIGVTDRTMRRWRRAVAGARLQRIVGLPQAAAESEAGAGERSGDRCCGCTGRSTSTSTCGIFTRSCARSTGSGSATRG